MRERIIQVNRVWLAAVLVMVGSSFLVAFLELLIPDEGTLLLVSQCMLLIPSLVYLAMRGNGKEAVGLKKIPIGTVPLLVVLMGLLLPLVSLLNMISLLFSENLIGTTAEDIVTGHSLLGAVVMIALVPAMVEELLFRGIIYHDGYRQARPVEGMILCGLMFGLLHMNLNQFCYAFVLGMILCLVMEGTGSLIATTVMHFTLNTYSVVSLYIAEKLADNEQFAEFMEAAEDAADMTPAEIANMILTLIPVTIMCLFLAYLLFRKISRMCGGWDRVCGIFAKRDKAVTTWEACDVPAQKPVSLITPAWVIGVVICAVIMILVQLMGTV